MDRNSAIGLTLIAVLLIIYFNYFSPTPPPPDSTNEVTSSEPAEVDSLVTQSPDETGVKSDSNAIRQFGSLSNFVNGTERTITVENNDLIVALTNQGGVFKEIQLKKFKTYYQQPLYLVTEESNEFSLLGVYEGKEV
ncbi:MAG: hypothetical protein RIA63_01395, partial [Cyclobacteriaceae bacterium]